MTKLKIESIHFEYDIFSSFNEMFQSFDTALKKNSKGYFVALNPEKIVNTHKKINWKKIWSEALGIYVDGVGIVHAVKILEKKKVERIFPLDSVLKKLDNISGKLFLFGSEKQVLSNAVVKIKDKYPNIQIIGAMEGYNYDNASVVNEINRTKPNVAIIALGSPLQEEWIYENLPLINQGIFFGVGGALDALSGKTKRAPVFFQKIGMEWLFRLVTQPSRFHRQLKLVTFVRAVFTEKFRRLFKS